MAGVTASEHDAFHLCADYGLGPCHLHQIEVVGEKLADVSFDLTRLRDNVLEMPVPFCLNLLSTGEQLQIRKALHLYNLTDSDVPQIEVRDALLAILTSIISSEGYYERALMECNDYALGLLDIIIEKGGTSGSLVDVHKIFSERFESLYYYPSHRALTRLGLAYAVDSATRHYYLLPKGLVDARKRFG
jgi:hypothetical protein